MPLPSMHYEYMERKTAKVSSDFHVRFDNAYYSVDKAFLHKKVSIKASSTVVRIYSLSGEFLCEWPRATRKGQRSTNPEDLLSGMAHTLSKKPSLFERIRKPLSALFLNQGCMKSRPTACVLVSWTSLRNTVIKPWRNAVSRLLHWTSRNIHSSRIRYP